MITDFKVWFGFGGIPVVRRISGRYLHRADRVGRTRVIILLGVAQLRLAWARRRFLHPESKGLEIDGLPQYLARDDRDGRRPVGPRRRHDLPPDEAEGR